MPELLIGLGKNLGVDSSPADIRASECFTSVDTDITVDAIGILYQQRTGDTHILFCGGHTSGKDIKSEAQAMKDELVRKFKISPDVVFIEEGSFDTRSNALEVKNWLAKTSIKYSGVAAVSLGLHNEAVEFLFDRNGVSLDEVIASDEVVSRRSAKDIQRIMDWRGTDRVKQEYRKERIRNLLLHTIDPDAYLTYLVALFSRKLVYERPLSFFKGIKPRHEALGSTI